ncbi:TonB family protein [Pontibacter sp. JAM-7]|uniref:energy transducer TonB n=1 Tax=Pontibacter sp. JAM-7 TaxID=3366581 RepID=UPI003AF6A9A3
MPNPTAAAKPSWLARRLPLILALLLAGLAHAALLQWVSIRDYSDPQQGGGAVTVQITAAQPTDSVIPETKAAELPDSPADTSAITEEIAKHKPANTQPNQHEPDLQPSPAITKPTPAPRTAPPATPKRSQTTQPPEPVFASGQTNTTASTLSPAKPPSDKVTSEVSTPPALTVVSGRTPNYPPLAVRRQQEGEVRVKLWLNQHGKVTRHELVQSSHHKLLDQAVIRFIYLERFQTHAVGRITEQQLFKFQFRLE